MSEEVTVEEAREEKEEKKPEELLKEKDEKIKELEDKLIRMVAEMEHLKRQFKKEKEEFQRYCHEEIVKAIIPAIDNLERAITHADDESNFKALKEGIEITLKMLLKSLEKFGVKPIESKGQRFDPYYHEAMAQVETDEHEPGTVVEEYQKGYMIRDRLLRPALVCVAKSKEKKEEVKDGKKEE